jgi:hypothetical protein
MLVQMWVLATFLLVANTAVAQASSPNTLWLVGGYNCGDGTAGRANKKLILFADGRWTKPSALGPSLVRIVWIRMQSRGTRSLGAFVAATESHGRFWQRDDKLRLYRLEPGVVHTGPFEGVESMFVKQTPDAMLRFDQVFLIDPDSHDLVEVLPYNAQRQPVRCAPDGLF